MSKLQDFLYTIYLKTPANLFDEFLLECQKSYEKPAHSLKELKNRNNKKIKGDMFEEFSILYLKYVKQLKNVWLLKDVPSELLEKLSMKRQDMGIDIIAENLDGSFIAIQCKYKKATGFRQNILSWRSLSTFYALCLRTGPWSKYIIITNCVYTRHQGKKTEKDASYCLKTLQNITKDEWLKMCQVEGKKLCSEEENTNVPTKSSTHPTKEELRILREKIFSSSFL